MLEFIIFGFPSGLLGSPRITCFWPFLSCTEDCAKERSGEQCKNLGCSWCPIGRQISAGGSQVSIPVRRELRLIGQLDLKPATSFALPLLFRGLGKAASIDGLNLSGGRWLASSLQRRPVQSIIWSPSRQETCTWAAALQNGERHPIRGRRNRKQNVGGVCFNRESCFQSMNSLTSYAISVLWPDPVA